MAAVIVVLVGLLVVTLVEVVRRRGVLSPLEKIDVDYKATRCAMNDAANQSWRNLID